jgi:GTPase SAR1 family protein
MNDEMSDNNGSIMVIRHKVVMVGDICVGKTSIICRFTEDKFKESYDVTNFYLISQQ